MSAAARSVIWINVFVLLLGLHAIPYFEAASSTGLNPQPAAFQLGLVWCYAIAGLWACLSISRAALLVSSALRLHTLSKHAVDVEPDPAMAPFLCVKTMFGNLSRSAELCTSSDVQRPSVLGFFYPRILIPAAVLERLTPSELRQVVLHEMEHLRRGDDWTNLFQKLALVIFPLNPALLWVERQLCTERELACDDSVLRSSGARKAYAICLTHLAEYSMLRRGLGLALGAWERQSELVRRVHRILRRPGQSLSRPQTLALTGGLALAVLACAVGLSRSPKLVSFTVPANSKTRAAAQAAEPQAPPAITVGAKLPSSSATGHLQLAKATMPPRGTEVRSSSQSAPKMMLAAAPRRRGATLRTVKQQQAPSQRQAWVVMTQWTDTGAAQHLVWTVSQDSEASFAAIRTANGWLFIQI
jgi:beta-lactamase regulating signal transducer with metallopeptidase domain